MGLDVAKARLVRGWGAVVGCWVHKGALGLASAWACASSPSGAQPEQVPLSVVVEGGCLEETALKAAVTAWLQEYADPSAAHRPLSARVGFVRVDEEWTARVRVSRGAVDAERLLAAESCDALAHAVVAVLGLAIISESGPLEPADPAADPVAKDDPEQNRSGGASEQVPTVLRRPITLHRGHCRVPCGPR